VANGSASRWPLHQDKYGHRPDQMLRAFYTVILHIAAPLALLMTALRGLRDPAYRGRLGERWGRTGLKFESAPIWIHAVSVGEVQAAAPLVRALGRRYPGRPILVTTATPTGAQRVSALLSQQARHAYLPYDLPWAVREFLDRVRPSIAVIVEREIWPNLFRELERRGVPVVLASARVSAASAARHVRLAALFGPALARNVTIAAQTQADADRFIAIGADPRRVHVTGNIKFDVEVPPTLLDEGAVLRRSAFGDRYVWVAGSTHEKEEDLVLEAHEHLERGRADALLVLVPRHPNRFAQVRDWLKSRQVRTASRSTADAVLPDTQVLLVDTLGELMLFYAAGDVAFVGGSLVPIGGHNLLEPAALARPIVVGPHNFNAADIAQMLIEAGAATQVDSAAQLGSTLLALASDERKRADMGRAGVAALAANRGALERVLKIVDAALAASADR
jgi:3-deoxy-D-manno-octulosonic-acid transferase